MRRIILELCLTPCLTHLWIIQFVLDFPELLFKLILILSECMQLVFIEILLFNFSLVLLNGPVYLSLFLFDGGPRALPILHLTL